MSQSSKKPAGKAGSGSEQKSRASDSTAEDSKAEAGRKSGGAKTAAKGTSPAPQRADVSAKAKGRKKKAETTSKAAKSKTSAASKSKAKSGTASSKRSSPEKTHVISIDQGTTSTRAVVYDEKGGPVASAQLEHRQIFPRAGWVEHDAKEIWRNVRKVVADALADADISSDQIAGVGITNQRETTVVWEKETGKPIHNAIVWQDTRTQKAVEKLADQHGEELFRERTGLPLASYFAGPKIAWILDEVKGARKRAEKGELLAGTIDSWLVWNMTGGKPDSVHITDVTNASRTLLMNIDTLDWNEDLCRKVGVPRQMLPEIRSSLEVYGEVRRRGLLHGVPIAGILGDQQAATFGQAVFEPGMIKNTYGTGNFVLMNTGTELTRSDNGLITTVAYQCEGQDPVYALEGSIAVTGSLVQWLRDNLGLIKTAKETEKLAQTVEDNGGAYIVPAFSGLYAPHWRPDARGVIAGLTRYVDKGHIARAALEAAAFQSREVVLTMDTDADAPVKEIRVDGGMSANDLLMQFQADILNTTVIRPKNIETTALGAAYAAGITVGFWDGLDDVAAAWEEDKRWEPSMKKKERERLARNWDKAVERTLGWMDDDVL
ncbi:glycerol kinase GlpK [Kocuria palustris]|uniref:glycerol kinase GlpK n=1 Tax=Kocuria palustris TaxID=71999 RepID=UPI0021B3DB66|nr:glycerol kinase GlpK [Kocuria palustris]